MPTKLSVLIRAGLIGGAAALAGAALAAAPDDVRVPALVQSQWGQTQVAGTDVYNAYTPNGYPCGTAATALAQLMRFHGHPTAGVGDVNKTVTVAGEEDPRVLALRGGDDSGGPYVYDDMPLVPDADLTAAQRAAIGALCHDAAAAIGTDFRPTDSFAGAFFVKSELVDTFDFSSAVSDDDPNQDVAALADVIIPNLNAGLPVIVELDGDGMQAQMALCDGYGYDGATLQFHLNFGRDDGSVNDWYALPAVGDGYDTVSTIIYNIYTSGAGEIVSGRVVDANGDPLAGVALTATAGETVYNAVSDARGIYAFVNVPASTEFAVAASYAGYDFDGATVTTGFSGVTKPSGGVRGANLTGAATGAEDPDDDDGAGDDGDGDGDDGTGDAGDDPNDGDAGAGDGGDGDAGDDDLDGDDVDGGDADGDGADADQNALDDGGAPVALPGAPCGCSFVGFGALLLLATETARRRPRRP